MTRKPFGRTKHDLTGQVFCRWTVLARSEHKGPGHQVFWLCRCECGVQRDVDGACLRRGKSLSCGCRHRERFRIAVTHHGNARDGSAKSPTYRSWAHMKQRCLNPKNHAFKDYGGRGITIDPRWIADFTVFLADMGPCPPGMTIERNNVNGNYEKSNCRWVTQAEQMNNTRACHRITHDGLTLNVSQWAAKNGLSRGTVFKRLVSGWDEIEAITAPVDHRYSRMQGGRRATQP